MHAQDESGGNDENIENGEMFEPFGIGQLNDQISQQDGGEGRVEQVAKRQDDDYQADGGYPGDVQGQFARGQRALALFGVFAVAFDVGDVVDDIDGARNQAEQGEAFEGAQEGLEDKELFVEDKREEDEAIFRPLARAHGFEQGFEHGEYFNAEWGIRD